MIYARTKNHNRGNAFFKNKGYGNGFFKNEGYRPPLPDKSKRQTPILTDHISEQITDHEACFNNIINQKIPPDIKASAITKTLKKFKNLDKARRRKAGAIFKVTKKMPKRPRQGKKARRAERERDDLPIDIYEAPDMNIRHLYDGYPAPDPPQPPPQAAAAQAAALRRLKTELKNDTPEKKKRLARIRAAVTPEKLPKSPPKKRAQRSTNKFDATKAGRAIYGKGMTKKNKLIKWYSAPSTLQWV